MYPSVSDSVLLRLVWQASFTLAIASILVMLVLICRRAWQHYHFRQRRRRREMFARVMRGGLNPVVTLTDESLPKRRSSDAALICDAALDLLRPLRGEEVQRIAAMLEIWGIRRYLYRLVKRGTRGERIRALTLLAYFKDEQSIRTVLNHAAHGDIYVQLAALRGLARAGDVKDLPEALNGLVYSRQHNTLMLADILQRFGSPAVQPLIALVEGAAAVEVRAAAIVALGSIGALEAIETLRQMAKHENPELRVPALAALGRMEDPRANAEVLAALHDADESVRIEAVQAAGRLGLQAAATDLAGYLQDDSWWVRFRAAEALVKLGSRGQALLRAIAATEGRAGVLASQILAEMGAQDA